MSVETGCQKTKDDFEMAHQSQSSLGLQAWCARTGLSSPPRHRSWEIIIIKKNWVKCSLVPRVSHLPAHWSERGGRADEGPWERDWVKRSFRWET